MLARGRAYSAGTIEIHREIAEWPDAIRVVTLFPRQKGR